MCCEIINRSEIGFIGNKKKVSDDVQLKGNFAFEVVTNNQLVSYVCTKKDD